MEQFKVQHTYAATIKYLRRREKSKQIQYTKLFPMALFLGQLTLQYCFKLQNKKQ